VVQNPWHFGTPALYWHRKFTFQLLSRWYMFNFIVGVFFGILIATTGFSGISNFLDRGVNQTKTIIKDNIR
jgi:hypothetical protein